MHQEFKILCVLSDIKRKNCRHCGVKAYVKYLVPEIINTFGKVEWACYSTHSNNCASRAFLLSDDAMVKTYVDRKNKQSKLAIAAKLEIKNKKQNLSVTFDSPAEAAKVTKIVKKISSGKKMSLAERTEKYSSILVL